MSSLALALALSAGAVVRAPAYAPSPGWAPALAPLDLGAALGVPLAPMQWAPLAHHLERAHDPEAFRSLARPEQERALRAAFAEARRDVEARTAGLVEAASRPGLEPELLPELLESLSRPEHIPYLTPGTLSRAEALRSELALALERRGSALGEALAASLRGPTEGGGLEAPRGAGLPRPDAETLVRDFERRFELGRSWEVEGADPEDPTYRALRAKAERLNAEHERGMNGMRALLSGLSHDIRNGLNSINMAVGLLADSEDEAGPKARLFGIMKRGVLSLSNLTGNFLALGELDAGRLSVSKDPLELRDLVRDAADGQQLFAAHKGVELSLRLPAAPVKTWADARALGIALGNLVGNALKYTPKGGSVAVGVRVEGGEAVVYVEDSGIGISEDDQARLLAASGHRAEPGRRMAGGFGIGLPLVQRLLAAQGSRLELESEPGRGSTFSFRLPLRP